MKTTEIKARMEKKAEQIAKKNKTLAKKYDKLHKLGGEMIEANAKPETEENLRNIRHIMFEVSLVNDDIKRLEREIKEGEATMEKYAKQYEDAKAKESKYDNIPECLKEFETETIKAWDNFDISMRDAYKEAERAFLDSLEEAGMDVHARMEARREWYYKHNDHPGRIHQYDTDKEIHEDNVKHARNLVLNLVDRCAKIAGEITSWDELRVEPGNNGWAVITGWVEGTKGNAEVFTILAGGYNIQRLHVRTLVKAR